MIYDVIHSWPLNSSASAPKLSHFNIENRHVSMKSLKYKYIIAGKGYPLQNSTLSFTLTCLLRVQTNRSVDKQTLVYQSFQRLIYRILFVYSFERSGWKSADADQLGTRRNSSKSHRWKYQLVFQSRNVHVNETRKATMVVCESFGALYGATGTIRLWKSMLR